MNYQLVLVQNHEMIMNRWTDIRIATNVCHEDKNVSWMKTHAGLGTTHTGENSSIDSVEKIE